MNFIQDRAMTELLSGLGAGLIGMGLGIKFYQPLKRFLLPMFVFGIVSHSIGMYATKQIDKKDSEVSSLTMALYYSCWVLLLVMIAYFIITRIRENNIQKP